VAALIWHEKILIQRFNKGDSSALRHIYDLYKVDLTTLATALLFDKTLAEDVVHDVFARLMDSSRKIHITTHLRGYLLRAVANMARNFNRSRKVDNPEWQVCGPACFSPVQSPEVTVMFKEQRDKLISVLPKLPYEQWEVLLLRHYGDLSFRVIAQCHGVSISTVQGRYRYGLDKLRSLLQGGDQ
jgi:RNA polymerase sigma-70 factor (ECF subfamily)